MSAHSGMERRGFLARAAAGLAALSVTPDVSSASAPAAQGGWDMSWLDGLTGKHKQVFDLSDANNLRVIRNWLDAYEEVYGLKSPQVNAVIGITRGAFTANASDALYRKFPIGELWKVTDPETGKPALRNLYLDGGRTPKEQGATVRGLQARGTIFWQCNKALQAVAAMVGEAVKRPEPEVYQELRAGLNPGVIVVPAHTMLLGLCQERGCSYEAI
jgi:hypothetical protein